MRCTANPGGIGHGWVKQHFVKAAAPYKTVVHEYEILNVDGRKKRLYRTSCFVPSTVFDNQELLANNPNYLAALASLPKAEREAFNMAIGTAFRDRYLRSSGIIRWGMKPSNTHTSLKPFRIPADWAIYRGFDFGYAKPYSVGWHAVDHDGCIYRIKEMYGCTGEPNVGVKIAPNEIARQIREVEQADPMLKGRKIIGIADPSIYDRSRGESIAEMMEREGNLLVPGR